jgi:hypothetical protein
MGDSALSAHIGCGAMATDQDAEDTPEITRLKQALAMAHEALSEIADSQRQWSLARSGSPLAPLQDRASRALAEIATFLDGSR